MEVSLEPEARSKQFDIWGLIKRAYTNDSYILTAKHRMKKSTTKIDKPANKLIERRRQKPVIAGNVEEESTQTYMTVDWNDSEASPEEYDYNAEIEEPGVRTSTEHFQVLYMQACKVFNTHPIAYFTKVLKADKCLLKHRQINKDDVKAIAVALVGNSSIESLDLSDNDIGVKGAEYLADAFRENTFIKHLYLADNNLGAAGVKHIVNIVTLQDSLTTLDISGNGLQECDADLIKSLLEETFYLKHLNISHNQLGEQGGKVIGEALICNHTLESLDLSWNHLRLDAGCLIADGLAANSSLTTLNLAWNGLYLDGCRAIARALVQNKTLTELNLTCNRISKECLEKLLHGVIKNSTLEILRLGWNPITSLGAMLLLEFVRDNRDIGIKELDLTDQLVEPDFVTLLAELEASRTLKVIFGQVKGHENHDDDDDERMLIDENPIIVLMEFGKLMGFRLMDLFAALDKDGSKSLDHNEIRNGLRMVNIPLSDKCINILIKKLDVDGDGEIDFGELMQAQTEHRKKMSMFYAAKDYDIDIEDTEIGRVRIKLSRLMAKKMSGNPAFKRSVQQMQTLLQEEGESKLRQKLSEHLTNEVIAPVQTYDQHELFNDKMKNWKQLT